MHSVDEQLYMISSSLNRSCTRPSTTCILCRRSCSGLWNLYGTACILVRLGQVLRRDLKHVSVDPRNNVFSCRYIPYLRITFLLGGTVPTNNANLFYFSEESVGATIKSGVSIAVYRKSTFYCTIRRHPEVLWMNFLVWHTCNRRNEGDKFLVHSWRNNY